VNITWGNLKIIGQSKLVSMTIIIPLFGYIIFFNEQLISIIEVSNSYLNQFKIIHTDITLNNSNKLFYIYFGLSFLGIASILYKLVSPSLINEYKSMREYIDKEKMIMNLNNTNILFNKLKDDNNKDVDLLQDKIVPVSEISDDTLIGIMSINWKHNNELFQKTRMLVFSLYIVGFLLLFIPSIRMFYNVGVIFFNN